MAYNYLGLVNAINSSLNEVQLTSGNFATSIGFYSQAKEAVNYSIRQINQYEYYWPFNHVEQEDTLVADQTRYSYPNDAKLVDFNTFRIKKTVSPNVDTKWLRQIDYEEYLTKYVEQEYVTDGSFSGVPDAVFQAPNQEYGLVRPPNAAYKLVYEYYKFPNDLSAATDVPTIPERFKHVIVDGAMYYTYMFRSNEQAASLAKSRFDEGLKQMRSQLINRHEYVRSTVIVENTNQGIYKFSGGVV